jgi:hypothetical protein
LVAVGLVAALPLSTVPDKRQDSKQRRAARNRASRQALTARRENALASPAAEASSSSNQGSTSTPTGGGRAAAAPASGGGLAGVLRSGRPGDLAVSAALALAIVAAIVSVVALFIVHVDVDDRGEPIPPTYGGLTVAAREAVTGEPLPDESTTLIDANGPLVVLVAVLPALAVAVFAFWANRRPDRGRLLTFAMLGMAAVVLFTNATFYLLSLIALAVGSYQVRKSDVPARVAERVSPTRGRRRGRVVDAQSREVADDATDGTDAVVDHDDDPLAELEAELEAERAADDVEDDSGDAAPGGDGDDAKGSDGSRPRR